jgi:hypothetical protein
LNLIGFTAVEKLKTIDSVGMISWVIEVSIFVLKKSRKLGKK